MKIRQDAATIWFQESGYFQLTGQRESVPIRNVYRWEIEQRRISLLHERRGPAAAVSLFDLVEKGERHWVNETVHQCSADAYSAEMHWHDQGFELQWRIEGPRKDETIHYRYFIE